MMRDMDFKQKRQNMINSQLRVNRIYSDSLISAIAKIPMEDFVSESKRSVAYIDDSLQTAESRFLLSPLVIAQMLQSADLNREDSVLLVAGGDGYIAAILSQLVKKVFVLDDNNVLSNRAMEWFSSSKINNVKFIIGDIEESFLEFEKKMRVIFIQGAVQVIPRVLFYYLQNSGKLFCIEVSDKNIKVGNLVVYEKIHDHMTRFVIGDAHAPLLKNFTNKEALPFRL